MAQTKVRMLVVEETGSHTPRQLTDNDDLNVEGNLKATLSLGIPPSDSWTESGMQTAKPLGGMLVPRRVFQLTPLADGRMLATGGTGLAVSVALGSTEFFNPKTNTWTAGPAMVKTRGRHQAIRLRDDRVLILGGVGVDGTASGSVANTHITCEIYDPVTNAFTLTGDLPLIFKTVTRSAILLRDGRVMVCGGNDDVNPGLMSNKTHIFNPLTGTWAAAGNMAAARGQGFGLTLLPSGKVLAYGGATVAGFLSATHVYNASAEIFDPAVGTWSNAASMPSVPEEDEIYDVVIDGAGGAANGRVVYTAKNHKDTAGLNANPISHVVAGLNTPLSVGVIGFAITVNLATNGVGAAISTAAQVAAAVNASAAASSLVSASLGSTLPGVVGGPMGDGTAVAGSGPALVLAPTEAGGRGWLVSHLSTLPNGKVLVSGGFCQKRVAATPALTRKLTRRSCFLYDEALNTWSRTADLPIKLWFHFMVQDRFGRAIVIGGDAGTDSIPTSVIALNPRTFIYNPGEERWSRGADMPTYTSGLPIGSAKHNVVGPEGVLLPDGRIMVAGGHSMSGLFFAVGEVPINTVTIYYPSAIS